ncbi:site-specific DNA-methyltransferase [Desulfoscipio gibsoniae]|nr:site-specific DNA-methyltransferase [Desulfoscipio gibsoniae]
MIYIDPPYNTGNDFIYKDNFSISQEENAVLEGDLNQAGDRLIVNQKSNGRYHSNWLSMMYPRLKVAKDLLREDGVIFISTDDNEVNNLRKLCDEIFGQENFIGLFIINSSPSAIDYGHIAKMHDYALFYAKNMQETTTQQLPDENKNFKYVDEIGPFNLYPLYHGNVAFNPKTRPNLFYPFYLNPFNKDDNGFYEIGLEKKDGWVDVYPVVSKKDNIQHVWRWSKIKAIPELNREIVGYKTAEGEFRIVQKTRLTGKVIRSLQIDKEVSSRRGTAEVEKIFGKKLFPFPKPIELIERFISIGMEDNDIILDFFAGSATTAHAVMQLNAKDGGNRKFIMVQLPEPCEEKSEAFKGGFKNISEIGKERIRKAGEKIKKENKDKVDKESIENLDVGFKVFRTADTNIRWFSEAIKSDIFDYDQTMSEKDKLDFNPGYTDIDVVYEILLRHRDIPLSTNVEKLSSIGERTYIFADTVVVCLEENVTETIIDKIAAIEPMPTKVIFRDSAFEDNISLKTNSMLRLEAQMKKNSGIEKKAYRVEFI